MEPGDVSPTLTSNHNPKGVIADRLRAQLSEMKARHAETDRLVQETIAEARELIAETEALLIEERPD